MGQKLFPIVLFLLSNVLYFSDAFLIDSDIELIGNVLNNVSLPSIAKFVKENNVKISNPDCLEDIMDASIFQPWVLRMVDASGKIPHGLLRLGWTTIGQHKQCIETSFVKPSGRTLTGQHCMLQFTFSVPGTRQTDIPNYSTLILDSPVKNSELLLRNDENSGFEIPIRIGICFPSSCSASDFNDIISQFISFVHIMEESCSVERKTIELSSGNIGAISFLSVIGFIMLCSSLYDIWYQNYKKGDSNDQNKYLTAFSVYTNSQKLFTTSENPGPLAAMHGIRVMSIFWIILAHRYQLEITFPLENLADFLVWIRTISSNIVSAGSIAVDTFFLMSGILLSYVFFKSAKLKNAFRELPMFYIHRILRLTPLLAAVVLIHATLIELYGNGPYNHTMQTMLVEPCHKAWWATLLYVQNYVTDYECVGPSWYLAIDMQLYIISPLLLYPLLWNKKIGILWMSFCIATAQTVAFVLAYYDEWSPGFTGVQNSEGYHTKYYIPAYTRATPYFIGVLAGYLMVNSLEKHKIKTIQYRFLDEGILKQCFIICGWLISLTLMGLALFGMHPFNQVGHEFSYAEDTLYVAFHRTGWALGVLWVIMACAFGYGGPINWFLSLKMFEVLGRFSFALYLTHMSIQIMLIANRNHIGIFDHFIFIYHFFGDIVFITAVSYVLILAFESPIVVLEKLIFKRDKRQEISDTQPAKLSEIEILDSKMPTTSEGTK